MRIFFLRPAALAFVALAGSGCIAHGFFTDGTSVSLGRADRGVLRGGRQLPSDGPGYVVPSLWVSRRTQFGTDELVAGIERAAAAVEARHPGGQLGVGDLSRRGGGDMSFHRSHENGRDADLIFYAVDQTGAPVAPVNAMPRYRGWNLHSRPPYESTGAKVTPRLFDLARNWALVQALLTDPDIDVEYLFISEKLRDRLIEHAVASGADDDVVRRAKRALRQPVGFPPHDDHLHLRIRCAATDRFQGCVDEGRVRLRSEVYREPLPTKIRRRRVS